MLVMLRYKDISLQPIQWQNLFQLSEDTAKLASNYLRNAKNTQHISVQKVLDKVVYLKIMMLSFMEAILFYLGPAVLNVL